MNKIIKILKPNEHKNVWYNTEVGNSFNFIREDAQCYFVRDNENYINIVYKEDAVILVVEAEVSNSK